MHIIGKVIILGCLLLVAVSVFNKASEDNKIKNQASAPPVQMPIPTAKENSLGLESFLNVNNKGLNIDLIGPWVCDYKEDKLSVDIRIKDRNISAKLKTDKVSTAMLVRDDNVYIYDEASAAGSLIKGANSYLELLDNFSKFLPSSNIVSMIAGFLPQYTITDDVSDSVLSSCVKSEIEKNSFDIPKKIKFKEKTAEEVLK